MVSEEIEKHDQQFSNINLMGGNMILLQVNFMENLTYVFINVFSSKRTQRFLFLHVCYSKVIVIGNESIFTSSLFITILAITID